MGEIVLSAVILTALLLVYSLVRAWRFGYRKLALAGFLFILLPALLLIMHINFHFPEFRYPAAVEVMWLTGMLIAVVNCFLLLFRQKIKIADKIFLPLTLLGVIGICVFEVGLYFESGEECIYRQHLYEKFYLNYYNNDGMQYCNITAEDLLFVERTISSPADAWEIPKRSNFISFDDSILKFSVTRKNVMTPDVYEVNVRYDYVQPFLNGMQVVVRNRSAGAIDSLGRTLIPIGTFDYLGDRYNGLVLAMKNKKTGYVDKHGNVMIPFRFDGGGNFLSDSTSVQIGNKNYWINKKGEILRPYQ